MSQEFVLSASSVTTFLRCGRQWFFAYVAGVKAPPSLKAARGIAVHKAVEVDMTQKIGSREDVPVDVMLDAYDTSWTHEVAEGYRSDDLERTNEDAGEIKDKGYELVKLYHETVAPTIQPTLVEAPIQYTINDQLWTGQIDLAEEVEEPWTGDRRIVVRDTKTTARRPDASQYTLNMTGYAIGTRQMTGQIEMDTVLDYLVATKEPYYHPIRAGGPVTDGQIRQFASIVADVRASIAAGRFVPNGLINGACSWCGFKLQCPAYMKQNPLY
jgi:hypothetical protein